MNGVSKTRTARAAALVALVVLCLGIGSANAAFPAAPGLIVFANGGSIYSVSSAGIVSSAIASGNNPAVSPNGQTVAYDRAGQIYTIPITGGTEFLVSGATGSEPAWSRDGATLYYTSTTNQITSIPASGGATNGLTSNAFINQDPAVSPDGSTIAFASNAPGNFEIFVMPSGGGAPQQISGAGAGTTNTDPTWAPDGSRIAFVSDEGGLAKNIFSTTPTPPAGSDTPLTAGPTVMTTPAYSPDGSLIVLSAAGTIATIPAAGGAAPTPVAGSPAGTSPDYQDAAPVNLAWPSITPTGPPVTGETLSVTSGTWLGAWLPFTYQWLRCDSLGANCVFIPGATGTSYVVQAADASPTVSVRVRETASNFIGSTASDASPAGHLPDWPVNLTAPLISGSPKAFPFGSVISGSTGSWSGLSPITFTFQWLYCDWLNPPQCAPIPLATSSSYAPSGDYIGFRLQLKITAKNSAGSDSAFSGLSVPVTGDLPVNTVSPKILAGSIEVGSTLTTDTGAFSGATPLHYTYQWMKCQPVGQPCTPIVGAKASSYVLQPSDQGATIRSQVTAANGGGSNYGTSNHTLPILPKTRFGPANTDPPTLDGKTVPGSTLVATSGSWTGEPVIRYTYTWLHCDATGSDCTAIPNVSGKTFKLKVSDVGYTVKLLVTGRNSLGAATVNSDPTNVIVQLPPQAHGRKLNGTSKNDYLAGGSGADTIHGNGGNDTIMGGGGDDYLYGDAGNDVIDGGPGADHIYGGTGSDTIFAADGQRDWIDCGAGVDKATVDAIDVVKNCESISTPLSQGNLPRRGR